MAGNEDDKDKALAEKAYAAAASSTPEKGKAAATDTPLAPEAFKPVEAKPQAPVAKGPEAGAAKVVETGPSASAKVTGRTRAAKAAPAAKAPAKAKVTQAAAKPKRSAKPNPAIKPPAAPVAAPAKAMQAVPVAKTPPPAAPVIPAAAVPAKLAVAAAQAAPPAAAPEVSSSKAAPKTADTQPTLFAGLFNNFLLEEKTMDMSANLNGIQDAVTEAQTKAKAAFEKSTAVLGEISDFAKGNVEAVMESGKILADGMQGFGSELVAEGRSTFEMITGDIKELAAAKSPTDFFKIQSEMMRKNFDSAVAYGSKNSEAMLKLVSDAMAPISGRVNLAMEKVRQPSL